MTQRPGSVAETATEWRDGEADIAALGELLALCPAPIIVTDENDTICLANAAMADWLNVPLETLAANQRDDYLRVPGLNVAALRPGSPEAAELEQGLQARFIRQETAEMRQPATMPVIGRFHEISGRLFIIWFLLPPSRGMQTGTDAFSGLQENLLDQVSFAVLLVDANGRPFFRNRKWIRWVEDIEVDVAMLRELQGSQLHLPDMGNPLELAVSRTITRAIREMNYDAWIEFPLDIDGLDRWFEANLRPVFWEQEIFFCVEIFDCTQRHDAQMELRNSEERFRDLAEISSDWFWETDEELRLTYISDRFYDITSISPEDVLGKVRSELIPESMRATDSWANHWEAVQRHQPFRNFQYLMKMPDGKDANLSLSGKPVFDDKNVFLGYRGAGAEVTQLIEAEKSRRIFDQRVAHSQRVEALGTLAGGIAHDINNALLPVLNMVKMVSRRLPPDSQDREMLQLALEAANHCKILVQSILNFSRQQDVTKEPCDMTAVLAEAAGMLRSIIPSTITLEARLPTRPIRMIADASQIKQVLVNLAKNSADAIGMQSGKITIDCAVIRNNLIYNRLHLPPDTGRDLLRLKVSDTGQGMDEATKQRIFEPFFTTKAPGEGTGLGLAIVHSAVRSHDGVIELESTPGTGTTVTIYLPLGIIPTADAGMGGDLARSAD